MLGRFALVAATVIACSLAAGCGSSGPSYFLATSPGQVVLVQWSAPQNGQASGTITSDQPSGTAPNETLGVQTVPVSVTIHGSSVELRPTGLYALSGVTISGSLSNGGLTITSPPSSTTGQIQSGTLASSDVAAYNAAVAVVQKTISNDNATALAAQQAQRQAQANQQAQQTASSDLATLQGAADFTSDLSQLQSDVNQTNSDLAAEKTAAALGANADGGNCYNLQSNVTYDATNNVEYDATNNLGYDLQNNLQPDIATARGDITVLQTDLANLTSSGLSAPAGASAAISTAQASIEKAIATANQDISAVNSDVNQAYAIGNNMATGSCSGFGPGAPPAPIASIG